MKLDRKVFAITGGARGLGAGMASHLVELGAHVAIIDLDNAAVAMMTKTLLEQAHQADKNLTVKGYVCDISSESEVEDTFSQIKQDFGQLNGLINNAGLMRDGMLIKVKDGKLTDKMSLKQWQSVVDVNLTGSFLCGREVAGIMAEQADAGVIINISSVSRAGNAGQTNYSATKSGVATMVVSWAKELARYNIRVAGIAPGMIATDMTAQMKPEAVERMLKAVPLRRMGKVDEIAHTMQYILENDYFTGRVIEMDGGLRV